MTFKAILARLGVIGLAIVGWLLVAGLFLLLSWLLSGCAGHVEWGKRVDWDLHPRPVPAEEWALPVEKTGAAVEGTGEGRRRVIRPNTGRIGADH